MLIRFCFLALAAIWVAGCGTMAMPIENRMDQPTRSPQVGRWTLQYTGECAGRESETIHVTELDDADLVFDDFHLRRSADGVFAGSSDFIAPMPADGRDVIYTISYAFRAVADGSFSGIEQITEGGGHSLDCPIELVFVGE